MRSGRLLRRRGAGRRNRGTRRKGAQDRREQALHRRSARGIRARLRLPDAAGQRRVRRLLPARHVDCAAGHRQEAGRDCTQRRRRRGRARMHRQGQRPGAFRVDVRAARAGPEDHRAVAANRLAVRGPRRHDRVRQRKENSPDRDRREAVLDGSQHGSRQLRRRHPRGSVARAVQRHVPHDGLARRRAERARVCRNRIRRRQSGRD